MSLIKLIENLDAATKTKLLGKETTKIIRYSFAHDSNASLNEDILNKAVALKNVSKFKEAIKYLQLCIKLKPNDFKIYNNLGNISRDLKKYNSAKKYYTEAIKLNQNFAEAYSNRGELLQLYFNEFEEAIEDYNASIKIDENLNYM